MPAARNSSSVKKVIDSTPPCKFCQNSERSRAPGKRPAMPMTAMPAGASSKYVSLIRRFLLRPRLVVSPATLLRRPIKVHCNQAQLGSEMVFIFINQPTGIRIRQHLCHRHPTLARPTRHTPPHHPTQPFHIDRTRHIHIKRLDLYTGFDKDLSWQTIARDPAPHLPVALCRC